MRLWHTGLGEYRSSDSIEAFSCATLLPECERNMHWLTRRHSLHKTSLPVVQPLGARVVAVVEVGDHSGVERLGREACALPALFARARGPVTVAPASESAQGAGDEVELERSVRSGHLEALGAALQRCRDRFEGSDGSLSLPCRRRLHEVLGTLETEYVRLCDAERFLFARRLRQIQTGEADDDPEFAVVLERIVYASDQGDEVRESVAKAVQTIAAELLPYVTEVDPILRTEQGQD